MESIPEHGQLAEIPLPRLLLGLQRDRFSGAVTISRDRVGKRFLFRDGLPIFAESNLASESLGVQLMDSGRITRADYNRLVGHVEREKCKEGKALLDLGILDAKGLFVALKDRSGSGCSSASAGPTASSSMPAASRPPTPSPSAPRSSACCRTGSRRTGAATACWPICTRAWSCSPS
jgi:hypothetical protein